MIQAAPLEIPSSNTGGVEPENKLPSPSIEPSAFSWKSQVHSAEAAEHLISSSPGLTLPRPAAEYPRHPSDRSLSLRIYAVMIVVSLLTFGCLVVAYNLLAPHSPIVSG